MDGLRNEGNHTMSRFDTPSASLALKSLFKRTWKVLWTAFGMTLAIHWSMAQLGGFSETQRTVKPLTTQFVKRQPRLTKPLEMKKRPQPRRREIQRKMVSIQARIDRQRGASRVYSQQIVQSLARSSITIKRSPVLAPSAFEPKTLAQHIESFRTHKDVVNMSLELLDVKALDTGKYHAMVIQDPTSKREITGYFHFARAFPRTAMEAEAKVNLNPGSPFARPLALPYLVEAVNKYTHIKADVANAFTFDSRELFKVPIIMVSSHVPFKITESEAYNLGRYLLVGGFLYCDTLSRNALANNQSLQQMWKDALLAVGVRWGVDWEFERLPNDHPIYHCYFDFDGPPPGHDDLADKYAGSFPIPPVNYLEGVNLDGRLSGIMTTKNYTATWDAWVHTQNRDNTRQLQFAVNIIVFALTQEGSITNRVMDTVKY